MEYLKMLIALTTEEDIDIGVIEQFLKELPEKAWNLGVRVLLSVLVLLIGIQIIKLIRKIVRKSLMRGNADKGVVPSASTPCWGPRAWQSVLPSRGALPILWEVC